MACCFRTPTVARIATHGGTAPSDCFKILSWNVAGLRSVLKNSPQIFTELEMIHKPDIICLQETKIQTSNESDFNDLLPSYQKFWSSSVTKKGYSGTAVFVKGSASSIPEIKKQSTISSLWNASSSAATTKKKRKRADTTNESEEPTTTTTTDSNSPVVEEPLSSPDITPPTPLPEAAPSTTITSTSTPSSSTPSSTVHPLTVLKVDYELKDPKFSGEGRTITVEFPNFFLVNCYVPNSGQKLERLSYRTKDWDPYLTNYLRSLESSGKPVVLTGDLNVAHLDLDIYNPTAKHITKQAGLTPAERQSFGSSLATEFQDALRFFYPEHEGQFTYWSIRTNARPENKGLRLDYFICSKSMFAAPSSEELVEEHKDSTSPPRAIVQDSGILHEFGIRSSDHCPITLSLQIR